MLYYSYVKHLLPILALLLGPTPLLCAEEAAPDWLHFRPGILHQQGCLVCAKKTPGQAPDTDGDGMADDYEVKYNLNPKSRDDAALDADGDQFSNFEEYKSRTNPLDPQQHPAWWTRLRVTDLNMQPVEIKLLAINQQGPPVMLRINKKPHAGDVGDWFEGVAILEKHPDHVICRVNGKPITLKTNEGITLEHPILTLSLGDQNIQTPPSGGHLDLHGEIYTTHQLSRDGLLIREAGTRSNISFLVPAKSREALTKINDLMQ